MEVPKTALAGIRVLDLGRHQAGPWAGVILARLGAEVIKIERRGGEESRTNPPLVRGQSIFGVQQNSGKKSLTLDLRREKAKEILRELVKVSDVFMQNFRPGTIDAMGFSYEVLRSLNPRIIMLNVSAMTSIFFGAGRILPSNQLSTEISLTPTLAPNCSRVISA